MTFLTEQAAPAEPCPLPSDWREARRVLAVRLDNLGDVLVTSPAIRAIAESLPRATVSLLASPAGAQAGCLNPYITDVLVYDAPWMDPWHTLPQDPARELRMVAALRERDFDGAIIFSSYRQSPLPAAYLCYLAGIPLRLAASIDGPGSLLTTRHRHPEGNRHEVERGLDLVAAIGMAPSSSDLVLTVPEVARREALQLLAERCGQGPAVVLHPGCSMPARTYPPEMFAAVADLVIEHLGATVFLTGTGDEKPLVQHVCSLMRRQAVPLAGELSFPTLCGLIAEADLTLTNNTGPMHISAAVGTPVISLFALTNHPEGWGPWHVPCRILYHDVPCRICYQRTCPFEHECLRLVEPIQVLEAATDLLRETADRQRETADRQRETADRLRETALLCRVPEMAEPL